MDSRKRQEQQGKAAGSPLKHVKMSSEKFGIMPLTNPMLSPPKSAEYPERDSNPNTACQPYEKWSRGESRPVKCPMKPEYAVWKREPPQAAYYRSSKHDEVTHSHRSLPSLRTRPFSRPLFRRLHLEYVRYHFLERERDVRIGLEFVTF